MCERLLERATIAVAFRECRATGLRKRFVYWVSLSHLTCRIEMHHPRFVILAVFSACCGENKDAGAFCPCRECGD